ncbi:hypothetical protein DICPUDRAFT_27790 [Dictyostelium purpureum]|uniref:Elongation of fatty acids protein n=1 Tax=Dictyostelium purpureum TaxID=5786 RepID=F0ZAR6_DICPU|nr:uncharacterized protein DICPUDRAFT_27790 [Dictyostelium purpureum]EGC38932.1 hypothetical protein DICPUDRAFT_27790 [Dictyostelium purpureum]|eukprot:XP_003284497.1 hypothetical protein DICPUDRAFT_27790 [Dictyostelium purpureum]
MFIVDYYNYLSERYDYYHTRRDERVITWPLMSRPHDMIILILGYYLFIFLGRKIMKNQKPFELKYPLIIHNAICFLMSVYMVIEIAYQAYSNDYKLICNPVDYSEKGTGMAKVLWLFFFSKFIELMDTVFMVLRKKDNQITVSILYTAGGDSYFSAIMNSFVHSLMYGYYTLALLGYRVWWKKYLTQLQLIQFVFNILSSFLAIYMDCDFPNWMHWSMIAYMVSFIILFGAFYKRTYKSEPKKKTA